MISGKKKRIEKLKRGIPILSRIVSSKFGGLGFDTFPIEVINRKEQFQQSRLEN
jgi:hypothetical protein